MGESVIGQADAVECNEIEITREMIEAGFKVLVQSNIADEFSPADKCTVAEIFLAMILAFPNPDSR